MSYIVLREYGVPPTPDDCFDVEPFEGLVVRAGQAFLTPVVGTAMVPGALNRRLPHSAIARQVRLHFEGEPVRIEVDGFTYFVSEKGWSVL